jgi:uncharacterized protein (TIGR03083 family)
VLTTSDEFRAAVDEQRATLIDLLCNLDEVQWKQPSRLPGWSVQDNLSHLTGGVSLNVGEPWPDHELVGEMPYLRSDFARWMEIAVDYRRARPGGDVLDEWADKTAALIKLLAEPGRFEEEIDGVLGRRVKRNDILGIAVFDWWVHEQDMRAALGRPGHVDGMVVDHGRERMMGAFASSLPGKVPDVVGAGLAIEIDDLRQVLGDADPPALTLSMPMLTATELGCGRGNVATASANVTVTGDRAAADVVFAVMSFTP